MTVSRHSKPVYLKAIRAWHSFQINPLQPTLYSSNVKVLVTNNQHNFVSKRFKGKKSKKRNEEDEDDESDDEDDSAQENPMLMDYSGDSANSGVKNTEIEVNSLRLDTVVKTGMGVSRAKVEESFYKGDIFINGEKPSKKSQEVAVGDEIDFVKHVNFEDPNLVDIKRLQIISLGDKADKQGRLKVKVYYEPELTIKPHT